MNMFFDKIEVKMQTGPDIVDITDRLADMIYKEKVENGCLMAIVTSKQQYSDHP